MVSPTAEKFLLHYEDNAQLMPMYFVYGSREGLGFHDKIGATLDKYIRSSRHDVWRFLTKGERLGSSRGGSANHGMDGAFESSAGA